MFRKYLNNVDTFVFASIIFIMSLIMLGAYKVNDINEERKQTEAVAVVDEITAFVEMIESSPKIIQEDIPEVVTEPQEAQNRYYDVPLDEGLQSFIFQLCEERNIEPSMVIAVIQRESQFNSQAIGDNGKSLGLMQIQPRWHQGRMEKLGCTDLLNPYQNVEVGIDYLDELMSYGYSIEWVLMAYNGGPSHAHSKMAEGVVTDYAATVLSNSDILKERLL